MKTIKYKGYIGSVEFSESDQVYYGQVQNVHSLLSYEGNSERELFNDFCDVIEEYIVATSMNNYNEEHKQIGSITHSLQQVKSVV